ncbi:MAG: hypothetical protein FVQ78_03330 [Solirubrobacterales bacterium]|nr:hypothetical protein [Solirubrobacterales bacterium]
MSKLDTHETRPSTSLPDREDLPGPEEKGGHGGHGRWMMIACCVPMLAIAIALVAAGAGTGFLVAALVCTAMMGLMMAGMSGGNGGGR